MSIQLNSMKGNVKLTSIYARMGKGISHDQIAILLVLMLIVSTTYSVFPMKPLTIVPVLPPRPARSILMRSF